MRNIFPFALVLALLSGAIFFGTKKRPLPAGHEVQLKQSPSKGTILGSPGIALKPGQPSILREANGGELFEQLFPVARWSQQWPEATMIKEAKARFRKPYPAESTAHHGGLRQQEIISRVGILKAMGQGLKSPSSQAFFRQVAKSKEHLLVRRQALENLRPMMATYSEGKRAELLKDLPPLLLSLAAFSEKEILQEIWKDSGYRSLSENSELQSINKWEAIPCPGPEKFAELARQVNWVPTNAYVCDLSVESKLGRILFLLSNLELDFSEKTNLAENLSRPFDFLSKRSRTLLIDFNQTDSIAFNRVSLAQIHLGAIFFANPPLDALEVLIHEARHSDTHEDPAHEICVQGDIPRTPGGCDDELTDGKNAGAYSYGVFFSLALARSGLVSPADREYLESSAISAASRRFNRLLPRFATFQDALAGLNESGELVVIHPFAQKAVSPHGINAGERFRGISYDDKSGGLTLFGSKGRAKIWQFGKDAEDYFPLVVDTKINMTLASKFHLPYQSYSYSVFMDDRNGLHYIDFDQKTGKRVASPFPLKPFFDIRGFLIGSYNIPYLLSQAGKVFRMRQWGNDQDFSPVFDVQPAFRHASGGVLRDTLFGVGEDGLLYRQELLEGVATIDNDDPLPTSVLEKSTLQAPFPVVQYEEGTSLRALLDEEGSVWMAGHGETAPRGRIAGFKLKSVSFMKIIAVRGSLEVRESKRDLLPFRRACRVDEATLDPWFKKGVGLSQGRLVFEGQNGECLMADLPPGLQGNISSFSFGTGEFGAEGERSYYFAPVGLRLGLTSGREVNVQPYAGW